MTHIITIETENQTDFTLLKNLAQRLNLNIKEEHKSAKEAKSDLLDKVAGRLRNRRRTKFNDSAIKI
jgi:hypothetical protein